MATVGKPFDHFTVNDIGNQIPADIEADQKARGNWDDLVRNGFVVEGKTAVKEPSEIIKLYDMDDGELYDLAKSLGLKVSKRMKRETLLKKLGG